MKRILTLLAFATIFSSAALAQNDLSVISITAPVDGCALTSTESVTIKVFNFGNTLPAGTSFNVSYTINAGAPVTELVTLGVTLLSNSTLNYTFTTQANLSTAGTYNFDATVSLAGDINPTNNAFNGYMVTNTAPSVGGSVAGGTNVCITTNSGVLTLSGHTGSILRWEYSTDGGSTWVNISNTTTTQSYNNLTVPTLYRAVVQNGTCSIANSAVASMTINPATIGGSVTPSATVCSGGNSGTLSLTGRTGSVVRWERSIDGGITWIAIANTTASQSYLNLTVTTRYRALVQSGACSSAFSSVAIITVNPASVGGNITPAVSTVCSGSNAGTLTLGGRTGNVIRWEFSNDGGVTWINVANTTATQSYVNLPTTRLYRARVQSSPCSVVYSDTATVNVVTATVGGTLSPASSSVCTGINAGTITLSGSNGTVSQWEFSIDGGLTWTIIANTTSSNNYSNLTQTTMYRALSQNSGCTSAYSSTATVTVDQTSVGGTISGGATVCAAGNSGTLTLSGETGTVLGWESTTDHLTWTPIANTTNTESYNNLPVTTYYHAIVQSGVCSNDTSMEDTVVVDPFTVGGTINPSSSTVCSGINSGTLTLVGNVGNVIQWEYSTDNGITWITIINTTTTQAYNNITTATIYRALVRSGLCVQAYSAQATISVNPQANGGTLYSDATVCSGANNGTLTLVGFSGSITQWETSVDNGVTWSSIANTTNNLNYLNLIDTTLYRVIVASGVCPVDTSTSVTITVDAPSAGGAVTVDDTVCASSNAGVLTLSGQTGNVVGWEYSVDGGTTWINISNTTISQAYTNLSVTTMYRARVGNGVCAAVASIPATITVDPMVMGGTISGSATVCATGNSGTLTLGSYSGTITTWELSTDGGATWISDSNTTATENYSNLTDTTWYRAIVTSGACGGDTSNVAVIIVDPATAGGTTSASTTVCSGANGGTIYLTGDTGVVQRWEFSVDGGNNWMALSNTSDSIVYVNLTQTTMYRAIVLSGVCAPAQYSSVDTITVNPVSNAGSISGAAPTCEGTGSGTLTLTGYTGTISDWLISTDAGITWTSTGNTTAAQNWSNPVMTTWYIAVVQSGVCSADTSAPVVLTVYPKPVASFTALTVCNGMPTVFTSTSTIASGGIMFYNWNFADNDASVAANPVHTYVNANTYNVSLIVVSNNNCSDTITQAVIVNALPSSVITSSQNLSICTGDSVGLSVLSAPQNHYLWSNGSILNSIYATSTGNYLITVTDTITGCMSMDSADVTVLPGPVASAGADTSVSAGGSIVLQGNGGSFYSWSPTVGLDDPNSSNPTATPPYTVTYTLTVTGFNGCTDTDAVKVTFNKDFNVIISNIITLNGDGYNDVWNIQNIEFYPENKVSVYNRNGMLVFEQEAYNNSWNGTFNDVQLPDGTYYYVLQFTEGGESVKGAVTIISEKK
ncbi:MAG: gliding motility-associated C-terminal domain-containing protein [Bacteroidia bacterium]